MFTNRYRLASATLIVAALSTAATLAAERAGHTTRVQPASFQQEQLLPLTLSVGDQIFRDARVFTQTHGSLEMSLDDGSVLTLGPNSDIVVDEYVYSPESTDGSAAMTLGRGVLRMVSGRLPSDSVRIRTPVATIGIRGTDFTLDTKSEMLVKVWVDDGIVTVAPSQSSEVFELEAPAFAVCTPTECQRGNALPRPTMFPYIPYTDPHGEDRRSKNGTESPDREEEQDTNNNNF